MGELTNNTCGDHGSSQSRWFDNLNRPNQSQWLQSTLSELDEKVKTILNLIKDEGDTFAKRAEMFYKNRPQLIESVEDLHKSYRALAEKYDQFRPESIRAISSTRDHSLPRDIVTSEKCPHYEDDHSFDFSDDHSIVDPQLEKLEREKAWNDMRALVSKLMEDNFNQQAELVKRNDEKREAIKDLCARISKLLIENKELKSTLSQTKADMKRNRAQGSKVKDIFKRLLP